MTYVLLIFKNPIVKIETVIISHCGVVFVHRKRIRKIYRLNFRLQKDSQHLLHYGLDLFKNWRNLKPPCAFANLAFIFMVFY